MKNIPPILVLFMLFFMTIIPIYSQKIPKNNSDIKVKIEQFIYTRNHVLKRNGTYEPTIKKEQIKKMIYNFSYTGMIEEKIQYGRDYGSNFGYIGNVEIYKYDSVWNLIKTEDWKTYNQDKVELKWYTLYEYDSLNNLIAKKIYSENNNSLSNSMTYEYSDTSMICRSKNGPTYITIYDSIGRIIQLKQLWDNDTKMNWIINYTYTDTTKIQHFDSYHNDDIKDYSKMTICYYNGKNIVLIQEFNVEKYNIDLNMLENEKKLQYNSQGYLKNVEIWKNFGIYIDGQLDGYIKIKITSKRDIPITTIQKINEMIINDFLN